VRRRVPVFLLQCRIGVVGVFTLAGGAVCGSLRRRWCLAVSVAALNDTMPMFIAVSIVQFLVSANVLGANVLVAVQRYSLCARGFSFSKRILFQKEIVALDPIWVLVHSFCEASCWHASRIMQLHGMVNMQWGEGMVVRIMPLRWCSSCLKLCSHGLRE
jgi:hypothetical protein